MQRRMARLSKALGTVATAAITEVEALTDELLSVLKGENDHG